MKLFKKIANDLRLSVSDDDVRYKFQYLWLYRILGTVSLFMSIINIFTNKHSLMIATLVFGASCFFDVWLIKRSEKGMRISFLMLGIELTALLSYFLIFGAAEGFSAIWICLIPSCVLLFFGRKNGSLISSFVLFILIFFLWLPLGRSLLQFTYVESFRLRFPLLFVAFFIVSLYLETIRSFTQKQLLEAQKKYEYLYLHDALTGIRNRYGFNKVIDESVNNIGANGMALMILDLDHFKNINDKYGHPNGDLVLKQTADILSKLIREQGYVCRWGGEEFAVLLKSAKYARELAEVLRNNIEQADFILDEETIHLTVSIGMTIVENTTKVSAQALVNTSDKCLYKAKDCGRNQVVIQKYNA